MWAEIGGKPEKRSLVLSTQYLGLSGTVEWGAVKCTKERVSKVNFSQNTITKFPSTLEKAHPY